MPHQVRHDIKGYIMDVIVIKFGGSLFSDDNNRGKFWTDIKCLKDKGYQVVIVHGGGKEISKWIDKAGEKVQFVNGLRYTDEKIMDIVEMVLSGKVNKQLTVELANIGVDSIGISGRDNKMIVAEQMLKLGLVGKPVACDAGVLEKILDAQIVPIISPVSCDENGRHLNVNADVAANAIAIVLKAKNLVFMTDMKGVLKDIDDDSSVIDVLDKNKADKYIEEGIIKGGMIPKIESAFDAIAKGVEEVDIIDGREYGVIGDMFLKGEVKGTKIV